MGGRTVLGRVPHTQAGLLTRPQDAALKCLRGKRGSEGNLGPWALRPEGEGAKSCRPRCGCPGDRQESPQMDRSLGVRIAKTAPWRDMLVCLLPGKEAAPGPENQTPQPAPTQRGEDPLCAPAQVTLTLKSGRRDPHPPQGTGIREPQQLSPAHPSTLSPVRLGAANCAPHHHTSPTTGPPHLSHHWTPKMHPLLTRSFQSNWMG